MAGRCTEILTQCKVWRAFFSWHGPLHQAVIIDSLDYCCDQRCSKCNIVFNVQEMDGVYIVNKVHVLIYIIATVRWSLLDTNFLFYYKKYLRVLDTIVNCIIPLNGPFRPSNVKKRVVPEEKVHFWKYHVLEIFRYIWLILFRTIFR